MRKTRNINWPIRALPVIAAAILVLTSCGAPQPSITIRNLVDSTAESGQGSAAGTSVASAAGANAAGSPVSPTATDFVADWVLFGTPTPTPARGSAGQATAISVPATAVAQVTTPVPTKVQATAAQAAAQPAVQPTAKASLPPMPMTPTMAMNMPTAASGAGGNAAGAASPGDPARGKVVFNTMGCSACHDTANGITIVGPSLKGVASRAGSRKPGMSAAAYLRESILTPNAFIVPSFQPNIMLQNFGQILSPQQLNDLIAYLLTLK